MADGRAQRGEDEAAEEASGIFGVHLVVGNRLRDREDAGEGCLLDFWRGTEEGTEERVDDPGIYKLLDAHSGERLEDEAPYLRHLAEGRTTNDRLFLNLILERAAFAHSSWPVRLRCLRFEQQSHQALDQLDGSLCWREPGALVRLSSNR